MKYFHLDTRYDKQSEKEEFQKSQGHQKLQPKYGVKYQLPGKGIKYGGEYQRPNTSLGLNRKVATQVISELDLPTAVKQPFVNTSELSQASEIQFTKL